MRNVEKIKELEKQLEKHKKAIKTRDVLIEDLKENMAGHLQVERMLGAYIAVMVEKNGGEVALDMESITHYITIPSKIGVKTDTENGQYILFLEEVDKGDGKEEDNLS